MSAKRRQKFATQIDAELLEAVRALARVERRHVHDLVEEALADLIEKRRLGKPRENVMATYQSSLARYDRLYKKLAE
ncbi:MAG TPA: hypothetical protein PK264_06915 [Hyphomicrobiaceae bacterium]|nr:hypothetical protein [Hyphomicrobiaceae bacterium]